jgi:hypothetical protein
MRYIKRAIAKVTPVIILIVSGTKFKLATIIIGAINPPSTTT